MLHPLEKQAYKFKLPKWWGIHNVFHVLLLEQDTTKKERMDKKVTKLEFKAGDNEIYEVEAIWDSAVYANKTKDHLPG